MREVKFRAWDTQANRWVAQDHNMLLAIGNMNEQAQKQDYILVQYTGLCDRKGKEIFEDDIVIVTGFPRTRTGVVVYDAERLAGLGLQEKEESDLNALTDFFGLDDMGKEAEFEVIGNIYESPELLGKDYNNDK